MSLNCCQNLTDASVLAIAQHCEQLFYQKQRCRKLQVLSATLSFSDWTDKIFAI